MPDSTSLNPEHIITVLGKHEVEYVLIGALAARLQGFPRLTADADITPAGRLDVVSKPAGTGGYEDLIKNAVQFEVFGVELFAVSLEDITRSKKAADRPQDRQDIIMQKILHQIDDERK